MQEVSHFASGQKVIHFQALSAWRDRTLVGAEAAMKERERDSRDEELLRLKAKLGEVTMANELLEQKIAALEGGRPLGRRRSRR